MPRDVTQSDRAATGRHRAPGRNWSALVIGGPGRHRYAGSRREAHDQFVQFAEDTLHDTITTMRLPRTAAAAQ